LVHSRSIILTLAALFWVTGFAHAGRDASLPECYVPLARIYNAYDATSLTPPLIGAFAAPDSAMRGLAFDGQYLWAANSGDGNSMFGPKIYRLDPDSGTIINTYNGIINHPCGLAWDGQYLWHSAYIGGMIYQLDTFGLAIVKSFAAPTTHPFDLAWFGGNLYAVRGNEPYISVIDTSDGSEIDSIHATYSSPNVRPFGLTVIIRSAPLLLTCDGNYGSNLVNMYNLYTNTWVDQWAGDPTIYPSGLAYDSISERLWVSCYERDSIYIYDMSQVGITEAECEYAQCVQLDAYPNPFSNTTKIRCMIQDTGYMQQELRNSNFEIRDCKLGVYDTAGRLVRSLFLESGIVIRESVVSWDGTDDVGHRLPTGVYFLKTPINSRAVKLLMVNE
jgi:DNA-binding beta-propeller fold protein YncE